MVHSLSTHVEFVMDKDTFQAIVFVLPLFVLGVIFNHELMGVVTFLLNCLFSVAG